MNFIRISIIILLTSISQTINGQVIIPNYTNSEVGEMVNNINDPRFSDRFNISKDDFLAKYKLYSGQTKPYKDYIPIKGSLALSIDSIVFYFDTASTYDLLKQFYKVECGCGWVEEYLMFEFAEGKALLGRAYLENLKLRVRTYDDSDIINETDTAWVKMKRIAQKAGYSSLVSWGSSFYMYQIVDGVPAMMEEPLIEQMLASGYFKFVSRGCYACAGSPARYRCKRIRVFGGNSPNKVKAITFIQQFFATQFSPHVECIITPKSDFAYLIQIRGPSKLLALKKEYLWESYSLQIWLQNGFACSKDELEVLVDVNNVNFAKGDLRPPIERYSEWTSYEAMTYQKEAESYIWRIVDKINY